MGEREMGRTVPTKQREKYKNSRRKAKGTMNRQRNSWISEKGYTSCCTDPGFVSQIGVRKGLNCGSLETELHWTLHHTEPLVENTCFSLRSHVWQGSVSSSFSSTFSCGTIGSRIPAEYELYLIFIYIQLLSFWVDSDFVEFACSLHTRYSGPTGPDGPVCPVLNWLSCPSGFDSSHMLTVRKV